MFNPSLCDLILPKGQLSTKAKPNQCQICKSLYLRTSYNIYYKPLKLVMQTKNVL